MLIDPIKIKRNLNINLRKKKCLFYNMYDDMYTTNVVNSIYQNYFPFGSGILHNLAFNMHIQKKGNLP